MDNSERISDEGYHTGGNSFHFNTKSTGSGYTFRVMSRSFPLYPSIILCLGLLNVILLLTAVVIGIYCGKVNQESDSNHYDITAQALLIDVKELQMVHVEATKAKEEFRQALENQRRNTEQLQLQLKQNKTLSDRIQRRLEVLHVEKATHLSNTSDSLNSCGRCLPGWILINTSCYFYSTSASLPTRNWEDSRKDCISRGGDLAVIDSWEEQAILFEHQPKLPPGSWSKGIWIGLTDQQNEGTWMWVNNVTVQDSRYWIETEPNDWMNEDCGGMIRTTHADPARSWFDHSCQEKKEWLCEM